VLVLAEEMGLVFVLLPAGSTQIGAVIEASIQLEMPVHRVALDAFFLSKYEMTQGQWLRATGSNPSHFAPGSDAHDPITLLHPVENVSWDECVATLARYGLALPTDAQWEYGTRAGTTGSWWTGDETRSLRGAVNLAVESAARAGADWPTIPPVGDPNRYEDGHVEHAAIGSFRANPFGLYDVHGNVREYTRDAYGSYEFPAASGDGERLVPDTGRRSSRGGGFYDDGYVAYSAYRYHGQGTTGRSWSDGLRPARPVEPAGLAEDPRR
jgi:formylglycine-generating enzyme required for sulfatase activity